MKNLSFLGKLFYGLSILGIGVLHFIFPGFQPVVLPITPESTIHLTALVYLTGISFIVAGGAITFVKNVQKISLCLGIELLLFFILGHLPNRLKFHPEILGVWTDALKLLALSGGAFVVSVIFSNNYKTKFSGVIGKIAVIGKCFFAIMLVVFGIDHFLYPDLVKTMVPAWIPWNLFWTYFTGIALIGSGVAFFLNFRLKLIGLLLGLMLFLWLLLLHIPSSILHSVNNGVDIISSLECLAFCGIAILISQNPDKIKSI